MAKLEGCRLALKVRKQNFTPERPGLYKKQADKKGENQEWLK
jgi:hypothetical protein